MAHLPELLPKITSKGQITIPLSIHNRFGLSRRGRRLTQEDRAAVFRPQETFHTRPRPLQEEIVREHSRGGRFRPYADRGGSRFVFSCRPCAMA
jgi:bifunctional DNA-binding transcriptional regulator/antitoxin component of YhaV-PrlF toxin-antitoxin module